MIFLAYIWCLCLLAALLLVVPVFALVPRLRRPSIWIAAVWGALVGSIFVALIGLEQLRQASIGGIVQLVALGSISGSVYAVVAQRVRPSR